MGGGLLSNLLLKGRKMVALILVGSKADECESDHNSSFGMIVCIASTASLTVSPHARTLTSLTHPNPHVEGVLHASRSGKLYARKSIGESGEPCGRPLFHSRQSLTTPSCCSVQVQAVRKERTHRQAELGRPQALRFVTSRSVCTLGNAFDTSRASPTTALPRRH